MRNGVNMSLVVWDEGDDPYDHTELAANWDTVDNHDHTTGRGKKIPTGGLASNAVTSAILAPNSVNTGHIINGTILAEDLAEGIIGPEHLSESLFSLLAPLGMIVPWFRPTTNVAIPSGWVVCDGATVGQTSHGWVGAGNVTVPDLRNKFILGAALSDTGTTPTTAPAENATGGAHTRSWNHAHGGLTGTRSPGTNNQSPGTSAETAGTSAESPGTNSTGAHVHRFGPDDAGNWQGLMQRGVGIKIAAASDFGWRQAAYIPNLNSIDNGSDQVRNVSAPMESVGSHSHTVNAHSHTVNAHSHTVNAHSHTVNSHDHTITAEAVGGDVRPAFVGLLYIIKVRHAT